MDIVGGVTKLGEERIDGEAARSDLDDQIVLGFQRLRISGTESDPDIYDTTFVLMAEKRVKRERLGEGWSIVGCLRQRAKVYMDTGTWLHTANQSIINSLFSRTL